MSPRPKLLVFLWITSSIFLSIVSAACAMDITVTTTADVVNGDVSSISALIGYPGPDGISLRETIWAVNQTPGPESHTITFSPMLAGQVITLTRLLPPITRDHVTIRGFTDTNGNPAITLKGGLLGGGFIIQASDFTLSHLRIVEIRGSGFGNAGVNIGIDVSFQKPTLIKDIRIEDNVFEAANDPACTLYCGFGVDIETTPGAPAATIKNVTIARNSFSKFKIDSDAIMVGGGAPDGLIENLIIKDNIFSETAYPIELCQGASNNRLLNTQILRNLFVDNFQAISIWNSGRAAEISSGNTIENTLISQNIFKNNEFTAIAITGGAVTAVGASVVNNAILNTQIVNNLMTGTRSYGVISIVSGHSGATQNRVDGVWIANNTIANNKILVPGKPAIGIDHGIYQVGNRVTGVTVINTILWDNTEVDFWGFDPNQVHFCITSQQEFAGVNGNISADPKFINPAEGDFHLQAGSPAIDAGTSQGAPETDLEGHARFDDPATVNTGGGEIPFYDIGCFEYHSPDVASLSIIQEGTGSGTVISSPAGIDCGKECSAYYTVGSEVTLTATPDTGSAFSGWSGGGCSGTGPCTIILSHNTTVDASFALFAYTISPTSKTFNANGGNLSVNVTATGQTSCPAPSVVEDVEWISVSGTPSWKANKGTVKLAVQKNPNSRSRTGVVMIGGEALTIIQDGAMCRLTALKPSSGKYPNTGGSGSFDITVSPQDCGWNVATTFDWIHLDKTTGTGNGTAAFHLDANGTGKNRIGRVDVSLAQNPAKKKTFTVNENK